MAGSGPEAGDEIGQRLLVPLGERAPRRRQFGGDEHAVGDRFAVPVPPVLRHRFDGVAGGVAEVQNPPQSGLALVCGHHAGFDARTTPR